MKSSRWDLLNDMGKHWSILKNNVNTHYSLTFKIDLCSATSMESSRRDLLSDMAEHGFILKNNQTTHCFPIFQDRPMFSHINGKLSPRPFEWYRSILKNNLSTHYSLTFQDRPTSMGSPRRDLLKNVAKHRISKNYHRKSPRFGFTPRRGIAFPRMGHFVHDTVWISSFLAEKL